MKPDRIFHVTSSRLRLAIHEWGDPAAPPLILQHGGRDHARSWDDVAAAFTGGFRVIAPDLRGHGDSDWTGDGQYWIADMVYDYATIVDALALPPCPMIAHSLGGAIVTRYAALYPERVTRLVNIEGLGASPSAQADHDAADPTERFRSWIDMRRKASGWRPKRYDDLAALADRLRRDNARLTPALAGHLAREGSHHGADGSVTLKYDPMLAARAPLDIGGEQLRDLWRKVACPVLLVYGAESWASNPAVDGRAAHFADARVMLFDEAGHWVQHDRQADFIAAVRDFLDS